MFKELVRPIDLAATSLKKKTKVTSASCQESTFKKLVGSIDFAARKMAEGESTEAELGPRVLETLREPLITGNIHDFQFLGGNDFGPLAHAKF